MSLPFSSCLRIGDADRGRVPSAHRLRVCPASFNQELRNLFAMRRRGQSRLAIVRRLQVLDRRLPITYGAVSHISVSSVIDQYRSVGVPAPGA